MSVRSAARIYSHLSAPRHRDHHVRQLPDDTEPARKTDPPKEPFLSLPRPYIWLSSFRWMLSGYLTACFVFFSASLYRGCSVSLFIGPHSTTPGQTRSPASSGADVLSPAARLAKLVSLQPPPTYFGPFAYRSVIHPHSHEVTACLWVLESNLDWVPSWTSEWPGPTSLVVVTRLPPPSARALRHPALLRLLRHPLLNSSRLALHILHLDPTTPEAPNVFLNLARLFAPTRTVLLVPGIPFPPPPSSILLLSTAHAREPAVVRTAATGSGTGIASDKRRPASLAVLSPMLIPRDHSLWCVERFAFVPAPVSPRATDWDACLWQAHLETFGAATADGFTLPMWEWNVEPGPAESVLPSVFLASAIRHRLDVRYHVETCILATKRFEVLSEEWRGRGRGRVGARIGRKNAEKMSWLHEICREWSHSL